VAVCCSARRFEVGVVLLEAVVQGARATGIGNGCVEVFGGFGMLSLLGSSTRWLFALAQGGSRLGWCFSKPWSKALRQRVSGAAVSRWIRHVVLVRRSEAALELPVAPRRRQGESVPQCPLRQTLHFDATDLCNTGSSSACEHV
jgi:hypothetical protein